MGLNTVSAQAAASYILKYFKTIKQPLSKTKLQSILVYAHLSAISDDKALLSENLHIMHFGFVIKSLAEDLISFSYNENIVKKASKTIIASDIKTESSNIAEIAGYLDNAIENLKQLSDKECIRLLNGPRSLWHYIAFNLYKGNHLIKDYTKISNKMLYISFSKFLDNNFAQAAVG